MIFSIDTHDVTRIVTMANPNVESDTNISLKKKKVKRKIKTIE